MFLFLLMPGLSFADGDSFNSFKRLYVFSDSLSDPGNLYYLSATYGAAYGLDAYPPSPPYARRMSNGPVAAEYLAKMMEVPSWPAYANPRGTNFAVAGATAGENNYYLLNYPPFDKTGIQSQIGMALNPLSPNSQFFNPHKALFLVWGGPNDIFFASEQHGADEQTLKAAADGAVQALLQDISILASQGARDFLVPNMGNIGATPCYNGTPDPTPGCSQGNPNWASVFTGVSAYFNYQLALAIAALSAQMPHVTIKVFDTFAFQNHVIANAPRYGFRNVREQCLLNPRALSKRCQGYLWFDSIHPTTDGHKLIGKEFAKFIERSWGD